MSSDGEHSEADIQRALSSGCRVIVLEDDDESGME